MLNGTIRLVHGLVELQSPCSLHEYSLPLSKVKEKKNRFVRLLSVVKSFIFYRVFTGK